MPTVRKSTPRLPLLLSLGLGLVILGIKFLAYYLTGSMALKSDALEGIVNVLAAGFAFASLLYAEKPADEDHPYGHGKIELFSAAFEGGLILLAAILIAYESVETLIRGPQLQSLGMGMVLNFVAGAANGLLGFYLIRSGRKNRSTSIEADGHHLMSDFVTTVGVMVGLAVVYVTQIAWLDPVIAIIFSGWLLHAGLQLLKGSIGGLMDNEDPELLDRLVGAMNQHRVPEIISVHEMRTLRSGRYSHIDLHAAVPEHYSVKKTHEIVELFERQVLAVTGIEGEFHTHVDPCDRLYCDFCSVADCPIRRI
ncbi:MAG: cation transporter, partial [Leptospiraceae bacterium]|nr:cation transporter [Leptospiraceae bacterium]